jgi:CubicO group peptidase (beta-lactamase class C family)
VSNFAIAVIKEGCIEKQWFHSKNKKVDKNTIFEVASLSKFVSTVGIIELSDKR